MRFWYRKTARVIFTGVSHAQKSEPFPFLELDLDGIEGDSYYGQTCRLGAAGSGPIARYFGYSNKDRCENDRQFSAVSLAEIERLISELGLIAERKGEPSLTLKKGVAQCMAVNLVIDGIDYFDKLPPGSVMVFENPLGEDTFQRGTMLEVGSHSSPCLVPHSNIVEMMRAEVDPFWGPKERFGKYATAWQGTFGRVKLGGDIFPNRGVEVWVPGHIKMEEFALQDGFESIELPAH
ncbi:hypothetical protein HYX70_03005 [Candidatus Saccharibacteria bacterium]|nr:hypothetical protein [Candidatus Saccharibacteria bacterium]